LDTSADIPAGTPAQTPPESEIPVGTPAQTPPESEIPVGAPTPTPTQAPESEVAVGEPTSAPVRKRLGEILIERGKLDAGGLDRALRVQEETPEKLGALLVTLGLVAQREVSEALAVQLDLPLVEATGYPELPILEERISARFLREARALPLSEDEEELALAMADPTDSYTISAFEMVTGRRVRPLVAIPTELEAALERLYGAGKSALGQIFGDVEQRDDLAFDADVQQLKDLASERR
jgi:general secretion pathway protein E